VPIRLGYAAINLSLQEQKSGPRLRSITARRLSTLAPKERRPLLFQVAHNNLKTLEAVLRWNHHHGIRLFRISSDLIPLATHPVAAGWDWQGDLDTAFAACARLAREFGARLTMHPGQYTVLNAPNPDVVNRAVADLAYHARVLELLELGPESGLVLHVGGGYGDKRAAAKRFAAHFRGLEERIANRLWLENDDVTYDTAEVLDLALEIGRPMVFDLHHHRVLRTDDWLPWLEAVLPTWGGLRPKLHFSSPRDGARSRHHADYVDPDDFRAFLQRTPGLEADVVLECKMKERALLALREALDLQG
jgi:UV DNA damage endonuclease